MNLALGWQEKSICGREVETFCLNAGLNHRTQLLEDKHKELHHGLFPETLRYMKQGLIEVRWAVVLEKILIDG